MAGIDSLGIDNEVYLLSRSRGAYYAEDQFVEEYGYEHSEVETRSVLHPDPYKKLIICFVSE